MTTLIGSGISTKLDSFAAGKEAAYSAYLHLGRNNPDIIITFISTIFNQQETIKGIRSIIKDAPLIGCSSMGSISTYGSHVDSAAVFIISSDSIIFSSGIGDKISKNPRLAGNRAVIKAMGSTYKSKPKQAYIMFSDSISGNSSDILRGSQELLGTSFLIIGGGASSKSCVQKTYQYMGNEIQTDSVVGALISGDIKLGIGKSSDWKPVGKPHTVTWVKSNIIKEIDGKRAVGIYEEYLEKSSDELKKEGICKLGINYPIGVIRSYRNTEHLTRVPLAIEENGGLVLNGDIKEGENISLMIGDNGLFLDSAKKAALEAMDDIKNAKIKFALVFSDIGRLLLLRSNSYKEIEIVRETIGRNIPIMGCYTFGEYAPFNTTESIRQCYFNNHSISITLFSE